MTTTEIESICNEALTPKERERLKMHRRICNSYRRERKRLPRASNHRICGILAERYKKSIPNIRQILINETGNEYEKYNRHRLPHTE